MGMSERVELIWYGDDAPQYDLGPEHPLRPMRVTLTRALIRAYGLLDGTRVLESTGRDATDQELLAVHTERYLDATRRAGHGEQGPWWEFGFGPGDNPIFPNMHEAGGPGHQGERPAAPVHGRRRLASCLRGDRATARDRVEARCSGHPARVRHAPHRSPG